MWVITYARNKFLKAIVALHLILDIFPKAPLKQDAK